MGQSPQGHSWIRTVFPQDRVPASKLVSSMQEPQGNKGAKDPWEHGVRDPQMNGQNQELVRVRGPAQGPPGPQLQSEIQQELEALRDQVQMQPSELTVRASSPQKHNYRRPQCHQGSPC